MSEISDSIRKSFAENDSLRDAGLTTPDDVFRWNDIQYGNDPKWQLLDIYKPKLSKEKLPVIISVHGGGWVYGDKEGYQFYCMDLCRRGFAVVNFTYRLAPENKFPAALEDLNLVAEFIMSQGENYGMDINNIFAVGDSAGATYLGLYAEILTNKEYANEYKFSPPEEFMFKAIALNCGYYYFDHKIAREMDRELIKDLFENKGIFSEISLISVSEHITDCFPPTYVMTATRDFLKNQIKYMEEALLENDIPHVIRFVACKFASEYRRGEKKIPKHRDNVLVPPLPSGEPIMDHVFHLEFNKPESIMLNDEECHFFKEYMS